MTFIEHGLIGGAIAYQADPNLFFWGAAAGIAPDILPMGLALYKTGIRQVARRIASGQTDDLPAYVYTAYDFTHSFITTAAIFFILYLIQPNLAILAISYGAHIICDVPFHNNRFSTRFLYPLNNFHIRGYPLAKHRWVHLMNLSIILIIYIYLPKILR